MNRPIQVLLLSIFICALPISLQAVSPTIVITQFYVGTGGANGPQSTYVELFNRSAAVTDMSGWTLQSWAAGLGVWQTISLSGSLAPGQYYLIRTGDVGGRASLPQPDKSGTLNFDTTSGRLAVVTAATPLTTACESPSTALDIVSYGSINCQSPSPLAAPSPGVTFLRKDGGCVDTDDIADFASLSPLPRNTASSRNVCVASDTIGNRTFTFPDLGGTVLQSSGTASALTVGYVRVQPDASKTAPNGIAILGLRQGGKLISEASVSVSRPLTKGLFYVEVNGPANTGIAIANPNNKIVTVNYEIKAANLTIIGGNLTIAANAQVARFLTELPFAVDRSVEGTLVFSSDAPIGVAALRGYTNERGEFLTATLPIIDPDVSSTAVSYLPHFAVNGGWRTDVILINTGDVPITGTVAFQDKSGQPMTVPVGSLTISTYDYEIPGRNVLKLPLLSKSDTVQAGVVKVTPTSGVRAPVPIGIFSQSISGVRATESGITGNIGTKLRMYVEESGVAGTTGSIQTGIAIVDSGTTSVGATLELFRLDGTSTGLTAVLAMAAGTQVAKMAYELFPGIPRPFKGTVRITVGGGTVSAMAFRMRFNERNDLLISTLPLFQDVLTGTSAELVFPDLADGLGWSTQFVMFGGVTDQASSGTLLFRTTEGQRVDLGIQ